MHSSTNMPATSSMGQTATTSIDFAAIEAAADRLKNVIFHTPICESPLLNAQLGARLLFKLEPLQITGSFKYRGASNKILQIAPAQQTAGVVAFSSGNHAQAVAAAARRAKMPATIVMPEDAPQIKINNTRAHGAEVRLYNRRTEDREAIGQTLCQERGATLVRPYDDPDIIIGQGTLGYEVGQYLHQQNITPDLLISPAGGGGLLAGTAVAIRAFFPDITIYGAEPADYNDLERSLAANDWQHIPSDPAQSLCDALLTPTPGQLTFPIHRRLGVKGASASDSWALKAMRLLFEHLKIVAEPGGAIGLACILAGKIPVKGKTVAITISGGNVDAAVFRQCLAEGM